jgi:hypothetical protein
MTASVKNSGLPKVLPQMQKSGLSALRPFLLA